MIDAIDHVVLYSGDSERTIVVERFAAHGVAVEVGPVPRRDALGWDSVSVYVRDPDGNLVEVMSEH